MQYVRRFLHFSMLSYFAQARMHAYTSTYGYTQDALTNMTQGIHVQVLFLFVLSPTQRLIMWYSSIHFWLCCSNDAAIKHSNIRNTRWYIEMSLHFHHFFKMNETLVTIKHPNINETFYVSLSMYVSCARTDIYRLAGIAI